MSYYELLGVPQDATASVIQGAFFQLAKAWHPDRLSAELDDMRELATRVFARMSEAHQLLTDPDRRREYDDVLKKGGVDPGELEQVQRVLGATTAYQKALVLLKRNSLQAAEQEARRALDGDPDQADYIGLLAWIEAAKTNPDLERLLLDLDRAVDMEDNNLRVRWYRGQLLKRMGKESRALSDFRFILDRDPKHVDAQREVRLFEMRHGSSRPKGEAAQRPSTQPKDKGSTSMFGRLFKKP
jgi:curved DNA-binding protein CbpA